MGTEFKEVRLSRGAAGQVAGGGRKWRSLGEGPLHVPRRHNRIKKGKRDGILLTKTTQTR